MHLLYNYNIKKIFSILKLLEMFSEEVYAMIELQFNLMLRGKELGLDNLLNTTVELYRYFHNGSKDIKLNTANTYAFISMYCVKRNKSDLKEQMELILPDFLRLFVNACYGFVKLDYEKPKKKKRFDCF
jgi:hypothetical protein